VNQSPIDHLLGALGKLDVKAVVALVTPDGRLLTADGRRVEGTEAVDSDCFQVGPLRRGAGSIPASCTDLPDCGGGDLVAEPDELAVHAPRPARCSR
jgi:hypothetical protein